MRREDISGLVALIDRLEALLERSDLSELEVEVDGRSVVLRSAESLAAPAAGVAEAAVAARTEAIPAPPAPPPEPVGGHAIVAPLTGLFYHSPSPGADAYVREGDHISAGQVIGLIEAMKLFNEIKSDVSGTVRRLVAGDGELVKARETLIEVDPA